MSNFGVAYPELQIHDEMKHVYTITTGILYLCICLLQPIASGAIENVQSNDIGSVFFMKNNGQVTDRFRQQRDDIDFKLSASKGLNIFIGNGAIHYQWSKATNIPSAPTPEQEMKPESAGYKMPWLIVINLSGY